MYCVKPFETTASLTFAVSSACVRGLSNQVGSLTVLHAPSPEAPLYTPYTLVFDQVEEKINSGKQLSLQITEKLMGVYLGLCYRYG